MQAAERDWLVSRMSRSEWRQKQEQDRGRPSVLHREFGLDSEDEEKLWMIWSSQVSWSGLADAEIEGKSAVQRLLVQLVQGRKDEATAKAVALGMSWGVC